MCYNTLKGLESQKIVLIKENFMDNYKFTVGIEPTDKYEKAKQDLLQSLRSYGELTPQEKECLMQEFFGAANVAIVCNMLKQYLG